jgi:Putative Actinobacterial Holin-X, holin superfamily III
MMERRPSGNAGPAENFRDVLAALIATIPKLVSDRVTLFVLETQRVGEAVAMIVVLVVSAIVFVMTAWLALWGGVIGALHDAGVAWPWIVLLVTGVNLLAAALAGWRIRALTRRIAWPATVRRLTLSTPRRADAESAAATLAALAAAAEIATADRTLPPQPGGRR